MPWPATSFLGQLSETTRQAVLHLGTLRHLAAGEIVIQEGDRPDFAVVLLSGVYKVTGVIESGREALLAIRVGGDLVGELGLADGQPRSATVRAGTTGRCRRIGRPEYEAFLDGHPDAGRAVGRAIAAKLRSATRRRVEFATCPAPVRVARVLRELIETHGVRRPGAVSIEVALTQPELAALAGATEPTVQRVLSTLREQGVVQTGYRRLSVLDEVGLARLART